MATRRLRETRNLKPHDAGSLAAQTSVSEKPVSVGIMSIPRQRIRSSFIGDTGRLLVECDKGELPEGLKQLRHQIDWPIKLDTPGIRVSNFFGDLDDKRVFHYGVDLQVSPGVKVFAPEDACVAAVIPGQVRSGRENLADVYLYSKKSGILYTLCHLDIGSIPEEILIVGEGKVRWKKRIKKDREIGFVGEMLKGASHLHVGTTHNPNPQYLTKPYSAWDESNSKDFNPLLIFKLPVV